MTFVDVTDAPTIRTQVLQTRSVWLSELEKGTSWKSQSQQCDSGSEGGVPK